MELEIEVLWHSDKTKKLDEAGIDFDIDEVEWKTMTFYNIDAISPNLWDDTHTFCNIYAGGEKWIACYTYEGVKDMIAAAKLVHEEAKLLIAASMKLK